MLLRSSDSLILEVSSFFCRIVCHVENSGWWGWCCGCNSRRKSCARVNIRGGYRKDRVIIVWLQASCLRSKINTMWTLQSVIMMLRATIVK
jgi:hypothetical protein